MTQARPLSPPPLTRGSSSNMSDDIRDKPFLTHQDVVRLNFVRNTAPYVFRRHYRTGLRSHIMELLEKGDLDSEREGVMVDGIRWFPGARPLKMLRIFRTRFLDLAGALQELRRVRIVLEYLAPDHVARSDEFLVSYSCGGRWDMILCGLQEYVHGEILDPWSPMSRQHLEELFTRLHPHGEGFRGKLDALVHAAQEQAERFVTRIRRMVLEAHHIPDLAGVGNLLMTPEGLIKLVDINNITGVSFKSTVPLDDRGYPVCDKSIEALALIEGRLLGRAMDEKDPIYSHFLDPLRIREVKAIEREFHLAMKPDLPAAH